MTLQGRAKGRVQLDTRESSCEAVKPQLRGALTPRHSQACVVTTSPATQTEGTLAHVNVPATCNSMSCAATLVTLDQGALWAVCPGEGF